MLNKLERRIIELSFKHGLSHISSCLNTVNVLADIYDQLRDTDPVCLDNSHSALALFVVLEAEGLCDAEEMIKTHGTHAGRDRKAGIWVSGGSLGQVATVSVGMALADRKRNVYLVLSDGGLAEGCIWEALNVAREQKLDNLIVHVIANGFGAYRDINLDNLCARLDAFFPSFFWHEPKMPATFLEGLNGHYCKLTKDQYEELIS